MKRTTAVAAVVLGLLVLGVWIWREREARAQDRVDEKDKDKRTLHTSGTATLRVKPDSARVFFKVETYAAQIQQARADNSRQVQKILDALRGLKIDNLKMKSANVNVSLVADKRKAHELPKILGYHITHTFTVLVENGDAVKLAEAAGKVLDTALENGATGVDEVAFFKKDVEEVRRRALTKAVEDALANAKALVAGANKTITDVAMINGEPRYYFGYDRSQQPPVFPGAGEAGATPLVAGDLEISCTVQVTCRY